MTTATDDDQYAREQEELCLRFDWSYLPLIDDEDGWQPYCGGPATELTNRCRIDSRFRHRGSYIVRRLGGEALAERLVAAVEACPHISPNPKKDRWFPTDDVMLVDGVLFGYCNSPDYGPTVEICGAEVVAPSNAIHTPLLEFFADIWERRAQHAQAIAADLVSELKRRGMRDGMVEYPNGDKAWWRNGQHHREDGPAVEYADGGRVWERDGLEHREDGPAVELSNGETRWCINGGFHREDGPAWEQADGSKLWYRNGKLHREDGPAVIGTNGYMAWYENDVLLRCVEPQRGPGTPPTGDGS